MIWFTGLPSSGKSTLAQAVHERLVTEGISSCVLDSDAVRHVLIPSPGYTSADRDAFYATLSRLAGMLADQGLVVLVAATAHRRLYREQGRAAAPVFLEVYVRTPIEECERRDSKGLFARARAGDVSELPGVNIPYEEPAEPDVIAEGGLCEGAVARVIALTRQSLGTEALPRKSR